MPPDCHSLTAKGAAWCTLCVGLDVLIGGTANSRGNYALQLYWSFAVFQ